MSSLTAFTPGNLASTQKLGLSNSALSRLPISLYHFWKALAGCSACAGRSADATVTTSFVIITAATDAWAPVSDQGIALPLLTQQSLTLGSSSLRAFQLKSLSSHYRGFKRVILRPNILTAGKILMLLSLRTSQITWFWTIYLFACKKRTKRHEKNQKCNNDMLLKNWHSLIKNLLIYEFNDLDEIEFHIGIENNGTNSIR